ncbi:MAG: hypothetical protein K6A41_05545 [Bacteroidales bacterium]|nr:hypothetical protein [Bacteroidales bacterium]
MSQSSFNFPGYPAIKPMPSIKSVTSRPMPEVQPTAEPTAEPSPVTDAETPAPANSDVVLDQEKTTEATPEPAEEKEETLESNWNEVVDEIFKNLPMLYYTLKKSLPTYQDDILTVEVNNKIQEDELSQRKRAVLEYWRSHFKMNVDDFEIVVNEDKVIETAILTSDEQFKCMKDQNPELIHFLNFLKFRMKN